MAGRKKRLLKTSKNLSKIDNDIWLFVELGGIRINVGGDMVEFSTGIAVEVIEIFIFVVSSSSAAISFIINLIKQDKNNNFIIIIF